MAPLDHQTLNRTFILIVCFVGLFHRSDATINCYECEGSAANDSCATSSSSTKTENCGGLHLSTCSITRVTDLASGAVTSINRKCGLNILGFAKTGCKTNGGKKTCTVYCDTNLCNDLEDSQVDECIATDCKKSVVEVVSSPTSLVTSPRKCYDCMDVTASGSCATMPSMVNQVNCVGLNFGQCSTTRVTDMNTHVVELIERRCPVNVLGLGKSGCEEKNGKKTCTVFCSTDLCNGLDESVVDVIAEIGGEEATSTHPLHYFFSMVKMTALKIVS